jgi:TonB family protein
MHWWLGCLLVVSPLTFAQSVPPPAESAAPEAVAPVNLTKPQLIGPGTPCPYPPEAKKQHMEGVTFMRAVITAEGAATEISVTHSSGWSILDEAAVQCFATWRFVPATKDGVPTSSEMKYALRWMLSLNSP